MSDTELFDRALRAFDAAAAGGADAIREEPWFDDAIRAVVAVAREGMVSATSARAVMDAQAVLHEAVQAATRR